MKITVTTYEGNDYGEGEAFILDVRTDTYAECLDVSGGEPEDNTLGRDLNFVYDIPRMLKEAYEAGKRGEPLEEEREDKEGSRWDED